MIAHKMTKGIVLVLVLIGIVFYSVSYFVDEREKDIVAGITLEIVEQEKTLSNIAEITDRNGADAVVESIIRDCSGVSRERFDTLLNRLGSLNAAELEETESLFDACARFFSSRKAVMVSRMDREFEVYADLIRLLDIVGNPVEMSKFKLAEWQQLVDLEKKRSSLFESQVTIQHDIIKALQKGELTSSENITKMLSDAQNVTEEAGVINQQIDTLRGTLLDI